MSNTQFMGMLITAIISLLGGISIIVAIIIKPIINLNNTITKLDIKLGGLDKDYQSLKIRVDKHGNQIDNHESRISKIEGGKKR